MSMLPGRRPELADWPSTEDMTRDVYTTWPEGAR